MDEPKKNRGESRSKDQAAVPQAEIGEISIMLEEPIDGKYSANSHQTVEQVYSDLLVLNQFLAKPLCHERDTTYEECLDCILRRNLEKLKLSSSNKNTASKRVRVLRAAVNAYHTSSRGGTRTRTGVTSHWILSPERLPFRHSAPVSFRKLHFGLRNSDCGIKFR
jgi:hypothetical protein